MIMFTCNICNQRMGRTFSKDAYENGVVLIRCEKCDNLHLISDNLGWFKDEKINIETIAQESGKKVYRYVSKETMEFIISDKTPDQVNIHEEEEDHSGCCGGHGHNHSHDHSHDHQVAPEKKHEAHTHHEHNHEGECCDHHEEEPKKQEEEHKHSDGCCGSDHDQTEHKK